METAIYILSGIAAVMVFITLASYIDIRIHLRPNKKVKKGYIEKKVKLFTILTIITMVISFITMILEVIIINQ